MAKFKSDLPKWLVLFQFLYGFVVLLLLFVFHTNKFNILSQNCKLNVPLPIFLDPSISAGLFISLCGYAY
jgi:hypothetical protein